MGSVKDLEIIRHPSRMSTGIGRFHFSDRYSVFDWGEMPDHIPNKGASIALLSAYFFEKLEGMGIRTHYIGLVEKNAVKRLSELDNPSRIMEIALLRVIKPAHRNGTYDYSCYQNERGNFLIPLEVIYRNSLPKGSSVFKRLTAGEIILNDFGLGAMPSEGERLKEPIIDVSTKLEVTDRYITWQEAKSIANLSDREVDSIIHITQAINTMITSEFSRFGLINEDGKIEVGFDPERSLIVVDVLGTLDECRFTYNGMPVSKEIARIYYRKTGWYRQVEEAKERDRMGWKGLVEKGPEPLPARLKDLISMVYASCTNEITGCEWFAGIPTIGKILEEIKGFLD